MIGLTREQVRCLDLIRRLCASGVCPTYAEIGAAAGFASKSSVHRVIAALVERGHLRRMPGRARSLEVIERGPGPYSVDRLSALTDEELLVLAGRCNTIVRGRRS